MTTVGLEPCPVCPEGIVRCAHMGDRVVWLLDNGGGFTPHARGGSRAPERWTALGPERIKQCSCPVDHIVMMWNSLLDTDSLPEAEAEFARREALLRSEA